MTAGLRSGFPAGPPAVGLLAVGLLAAPLPGPAAAQQPADSVPGPGTRGDGPGVPVRAAARDTAPAQRRRPPDSHPFDGWDAVALPFRVATFPLNLLGDGIHLLLDAVTGPAVETPVPVRVYRDVRRWGLRPGLASLGPRSGPAARLTLDRLSPFHLRSAASLREYQAHEAGLEWSGPAGDLEIAGGFDRDAEPHFWGVGPDSRASAETSYLLDRVYGRVRGSLRPPGPVEVGLRAGYEENRVDRGFDGSVPALQDRFSAASLFGAGPKTRFFVAGLDVALDRVEMDGLSMRGLGVRLSSSLYRGAGPTEADFHRIRGSARAFLPVSHRHVVALRAASEVNRADSGRGVPFFHLAELGGEAGGRAYQDERFRASDMVAFTAEWRYEVWRKLQDRMRLEGFVFADEGAVKRRLDAIAGSDWRPSFGAGLRLVGRTGEVAHVYWATGEEGSRVQVDVGTSF